MYENFNIIDKNPKKPIYTISERAGKLKSIFKRRFCILIVMVFQIFFSVKFEVPSDINWIKMNVNFTGYYRVHYDETNWKSLTQQLKDNHMV